METGQDQSTWLLPQILKKFQNEIIREWLADQVRKFNSGLGSIPEADLRRQSTEFLNAVQNDSETGGAEDITTDQWSRTRDVLTDVSHSLARQGASPADVALFLFSLKRVLFRLFESETGKDLARFSKEIWRTTQLLDSLGVFTTQVAMKSREETIARQQTEMIELSTPVVKLWEGILALPLIGTLDSERTQVVMESLLQEIVVSGAGIAIIDITGVPTVDTLVAQHLMKTVAAARLMGAECIISGIRPQIAATIVHLGVDLGDISTKATLADAFAMALRRNSLMVIKTGSARRATEQ